jgi:DNA polymerase II small subunit/DNA polymerase delta subunit B
MNPALQTQLQAMNQLDSILTQLCSALPVNLMPGPYDLAPYALPQQSISSGMLVIFSKNICHIILMLNFSVSGCQIRGVLIRFFSQPTLTRLNWMDWTFLAQAGKTWMICAGL